MAMDHARVARDVVTYLGGADNIDAAAHCATRLRLVINDMDKVDQAALDKDPDLKGTFLAGGMFQIIVGPGDVDQVFDHMVKDHSVREVSKDEAKEEAAKSGNLFSRFIKMIADIFVPILPALIAGGLMMAINNVLSAEGLFGEKSLVDQLDWLKDYASLINLISAAPFAFLPVLVGFSAAKRFGGNVYLGAAMGAAMVSTSLLSAYDMAKTVAPKNFWLYQIIGEKCSLTDGDCIAKLVTEPDQAISAASAWELFGIHVDKIGYQAMVIPIICVAFIMSVIEKWLHKRLSGTTDFLLTPLITMLVTGFLTFVAVGPLTRQLSVWITDGLNWTFNTLGVVGGLVFGLFYSPIVVTGLHQSFPAVEIPLLPQNGGAGDFIFPIASMANVAQGAAALAVFLRTRDAKMKGLAGAGGMSAIFGITEPAIFGVNLRLRWPFFVGMGAAAIGSAGVALLNVRGSALGAAGFVGFVSIRTEDIPMYLVLEVITFVISFAGALFYASTPKGKASLAGDDGAPADGAAAQAAPVEIPAEAAHDLTVTAPIKGRSVPLSEVADPTFSQGLLGPGMAIVPDSGPVVSPVDGEVLVAFPTGHAYGLRSASGVELLIHVGMDTVKLDGKGFTPHVKAGDKVRRGTPLVDVDWAAIKAAGYETVTPVVVSNATKFGGVSETSPTEVNLGDAFYSVAPAEAAAKV